MTNQILALKDHLLGAKVTVVVMESTSDYWRPFYYLLEDDLHRSRRARMFVAYTARHAVESSLPAKGTLYPSGDFYASDVLIPSVDISRRRPMVAG